MSQPLYEIANEYKQLMVVLDDMDLPAEVVEDTLESMSGDLQTKCQSVAAYFQNLDANVDAMKEAKRRIEDRIRATENRSKHLKSYLLTNMLECEISSISCPEFVIKTAKTPPSVEIDPGSEIPEKYQVTKTTVSPDKKALKEALKGGESFDGIRLVSGHRLSIK